MQEIDRDGETVTLTASVEELRLIVGAMSEALNGAYAVPSDEWEPLVGQPPERADELLAAMLAILER